MGLVCYENEIGPKGKAYVILREGTDEDLAATCQGLWEKGARQIFYASTIPAVVLASGMRQGLHLGYVHDMLGLTCLLGADRPLPQPRLALEPLTWEKEDLFLRIYNESFFTVPNSSTYGPEEFAQVMGPEYRCGFALMEGVPIGIYELGFKKEHPEIGSIGLDGPYLGKGLGRALLLTVMDELAQLGHAACWLQVSTANERAYGLYQSVGFGQPELLSHWFEVTKANG